MIRRLLAAIETKYVIWRFNRTMKKVDRVLTEARAKVLLDRIIAQIEKEGLG